MKRWRLLCFTGLLWVGMGACYAVQAAASSVKETDSFLSYVRPEPSPTFEIVRDTGEKKGEYPIFERIDDPKAEHLFRDSFMTESVRLFFLAQNLVNHQKGALLQVEHPRSGIPAYLLLSEREGGFPRTGFYLKRNGELLDHTDTPYVDLMKSTASTDYLGSMSQIYPHELGHVMYHLLSPDWDRTESRSADMHYVSLTTDRRVAFDEGFAEHFENVALDHEPDEARKASLESSVRQARLTTETMVAGYEKDYTWPMRLQLYRASVPFWYQRFELLKRHDWVREGTIRFSTTQPSAGTPEQNIKYRNTGVRYDEGKPRNVSQALATEGIVSAFFTKLLSSDLKDRYLEDSFYAAFLSDASRTVNAKAVFTPLQNEYMKIFNVIHKYVNRTGSPLADFVQGYAAEYPDEKETLYRLLSEATGLSAKELEASPPEIWLLNKRYAHSYLAIDAAGSIQTPFYTFDLNAADVNDLMTFPGIGEAEAQAIVRYRDNQSFIRELDEVRKIPGLSPQAIQTLLDGAYDPNFARESRAQTEQRLGEDGLLLQLLAGSLWMLVKVALGWFAVFLLLYYVLALRKRFELRRTSSIVVTNAVKMIVLGLFGLASVLAGQPLFFFALLSGLFLAFERFLVLRKKTQGKKKEALYSSLFFIAVLFYSLS
ncbi:ComEA family DNA-binding protein [Paenibacillus ehimensis]|uniref:ComEA family DNA-binding protein n=1 Tax=Paenibacillus ehimensis TaxID=79264 RepID=UPI0009FC4500|nr:helix-hairpin-helix domain-containing protein [Paenibacillus ehimensis]